MFSKPHISPVSNGFRLTINTNQLSQVADTLTKAKLPHKRDGEFRLGHNRASAPYTCVRIMGPAVDLKERLEKLFQVRIVLDSGSPASVSML